MVNPTPHTWKIYVRYHSCPKCGFIQESRQDYTYVKKVGTKTLVCTRCHTSWEETNLLKNREPPEFNWGMDED